MKTWNWISQELQNRLVCVFAVSTSFVTLRKFTETQKMGHNTRSKISQKRQSQKSYLNEAHYFIVVKT
jgi:hypothetical protein